MKKTAFLVLMICALIEARGQKVSDPRSSSFWSKPQQLGISLGFGGIMQTGTMIADECNCSFENGGGMSSAFALTFENELAKNPMASEKLSEGIKTFCADIEKLEVLLS